VLRHDQGDMLARESGQRCGARMPGRASMLWHDLYPRSECGRRRRGSQGPHLRAQCTGGTCVVDAWDARRQIWSRRREGLCFGHSTAEAVRRSCHDRGGAGSDEGACGQLFKIVPLASLGVGPEVSNNMSESPRP